jgi:putative peptidoglycan lipid II flippase
LSAVAFLTVPATAGLMVLAVPIVRLLFERGRFHPDDTQATAAAVALYSIGLVAYTGVKVMAPAFYALQQPRVPLMASVGAVLTNLVLIALLHRRFGYGVIALGTALGSIVNIALLITVIQKRVGGVLTRDLLGRFARMGLAGAAMAPLAWLSARRLEEWVGTQGVVAQLVTGLGPVAVGAVVYGALAWVLRIPELRSLAGLRRRS